MVQRQNLETEMKGIRLIHKREPVPAGLWSIWNPPSSFWFQNKD